MSFEACTGLDFRITNDSPYEIRLDLDSSLFVDERGQSKRIVRSNTPAEQRYAPQVPITIPPRSSVEEKVQPADSFRQAGSRWVLTEYLPTDAVKANGARIALQFAFVIEGNKVRVTRGLRVVDFQRLDLADDDAFEYVTRRNK